jgi:capsular exopolysaccharide synthesis family protein
MTTLPTVRPAVPAAARPAPAAAGAAGTPAIDPLKLLKKHKWTLLAAAVAGAVIGAILHFILMAVYPIYAPFALYQCLPMQETLASNAPAMTFKDELQNFMSTQVQLLTSDGIIDKTLNDPSFTKEAPRWSHPHMRNGVLDVDDAARSLKRNLNAGVVGDSSLIRVSFWWTDKQEATAIVRLVASTYERQRKQIATGENSERLDLIQRSIAETSDAIVKQQANRARLLQDQNVDALEQANSAAVANAIGIQKKMIDNRADMEAIKSRRKQMEDELASPTGPTYTSDIRQKVEEDYNLVKIKDEVNLYEAEVVAARKRLGPNHQTLLRYESVLEGKKQNLQNERERLLRQYFDAQLDTIRSGISSLEATNDDLQKKLDDARTRSVELTQVLAKVKDLENDITRLTDSRNKLSDDLKNYSILNNNPMRIVRIQDAQPPKTVSFPKLFIMVPLGIFAALGLVFGVVVFLEVIDQRVKGAADVAMIPRTRLLGLIPHAAEDPGAPQKIETVFRDQPAGVLAESYRQLRGAVLKRLHDSHAKSLLVLSGMPASGATSVVCNLAHAIASADQRVLIIDANFRRPAVHRVLGLKEAPGLADVLAGSTPLTDAVQKTDNPRVDLLSAGAPSERIVERLSTEPMTEALRQATAAYDLVLIDVAPAQIAGDALALAHRCDASLLVVRALGEKRGMVARLRNELGETRAEFLGVVINAARSLAGGYLKGNILAARQYQNGNGNGKE